MTECIFHQDAYARSCEARVARVDAGGVVLDRTVFYPLGGGQPGDCGHLRCADGTRIEIVDTRKGEGGEVVHVPAPQAPVLAPGTPVEAVLAWPRRHILMRYHTCLHLLCAVVDAPVSGGRMGEDKAHLDFDIEMDKLVADDIERRLNALIAADVAVECGEISDAELDANPELVKTMSVQPPRGQGRVRTISIPAVDLQPCGGTHVRRTAEIGPVRVVRIRSEGRRNKRVTIVLDHA
ncbi:MAG: alanyl-tRNA editing protein [Rhodocyclales bacterium]|nr:alanyl-tRNA editing protein [Rhodocyclales bacterium]